jgi:hypothetical protein
MLLLGRPVPLLSLDDSFIVGRLDDSFIFVVGVAEEGREARRGGLISVGIYKLRAEYKVLI